MLLQSPCSEQRLCYCSCTWVGGVLQAPCALVGCTKDMQWLPSASMDFSNSPGDIVCNSVVVIADGTTPI